MPKEIEVEVTRDDIQDGVTSTWRCPVALAMKRALAQEVSVGRSQFTIDSEPYDLPIEVSSFVERFDQGFQVEPFKFTLRL